MSKLACGQLNKSRRVHRIPEELRFGTEKIFAGRKEKTVSSTRGSRYACSREERRTLGERDGGVRRSTARVARASGRRLPRQSHEISAGGAGIARVVSSHLERPARSELQRPPGRLRPGGAYVHRTRGRRSCRSGRNIRGQAQLLRLRRR